MSVILGNGPLLTDYQDDTTRTVMRGIPGYVRRTDGRVWYVTEYFNTSASSITAGDWVELDETDTDYPGMAIQQATLDDARVVGVALETIAAGAAGPVLRQGVINYDVDGIRVKMTDTTVVGPVSPAASGGSVAYTGSGPVCGFNLEAAGASGSDLCEVRCLNPVQPAVFSAAAGIDLNGLADGFILDADADTTISAPTDDQIDIEISGADDFTFTANTFTALSGSTIATNTIAETTAASGVTIDGLRIKDAAVTPAAGGSAFIDVSGCATGEADVIVADNLASAFEIRESATGYLRVVTTNDAERVSLLKILALPEVTVVDMADAAHALVLGTAGASQTKLVGNIVLCDANSTGGTEALTLPTAASCDGLPLIIVNTGGEDITLADVLTGMTISTAEVGWVVCNGTAWYGGVMKLT